MTFQHHEVQYNEYFGMVANHVFAIQISTACQLKHMGQVHQTTGGVQATTGAKAACAMYTFDGPSNLGLGASWHIHGSLVQSDRIGRPLSAEERMLVDVFTALPDQKELTLDALKSSNNRKLFRQTKKDEFDMMAMFAEALGLGKVEYRRNSLTPGRQQTVLVKQVLSGEARKKVEELRMPTCIFESLWE